MVPHQTPIPPLEYLFLLIANVPGTNVSFATMVQSRKRKRATATENSAQDYCGADPPPFAPAHLSHFKAQRTSLSRSLTTGLSPLILNLILIAGHRLKARDFAAAAAVIPTLLKRYRKVRTNRWFFSREVAITGAHVLRRSPTHHVDVLDDFLAHIARDGHLAAQPGLEGYAVHTQESVLLERVMAQLATDNLKAAFDALYEHSQESAFRECALVHGYLGVVALALSEREHDPASMLRVAAAALNEAAVLEPDAYFYCYYAAATAIAAGKRDDAFALLRDFVAKQPRDDPIALFGLLSCLHASPKPNAIEAQQQRMDIARRLLIADPMCTAAADVVREANAWHWEVQPRVDRLEIVHMVAARIEHGGMADVFNWVELGDSLSKAPRYRDPFWIHSGRRDWWPSHFFRLNRLNADLATNPQLAAVKGAVCKLLMPPHESPYSDGVVASGVVDLFSFSSKSLA